MEHTTFHVALQLVCARQSAISRSCPAGRSATSACNYAGNAEIEKDVVEKVASFGKQLGIITDAVLALADGKPKETRRSRGSGRSRRKSRNCKNRNKTSLADQAREAMQRLEKAEPATARRIAAEFAKPSS